MSHKSELRQRPSPLSTPKLSSKDFPVNPTFTPAGPTSSKGTRVYLVAASIALSVTFVLCLRFFNPKSSLSDSYILCSPPGTAKIYTVDDRNSKVECLVVDGENIVDTGTLGT